MAVYDKLIERTDIGEPVSGRAYSILDHLICGFILIFPLVFFREIVYPGFTEQDIYFYAFAVIFALAAVVYSWRSRSAVRRYIPYTTVVLAGWSTLCMFVCIWQMLAGDDQAYHMAGYACSLLLIIGVTQAHLRGRRYLKILCIPMSLIYGFLYYHKLTGGSTVFGIEELIQAPGELIPLLLLACVAAVILFFTAANIWWRVLYAIYFSAGTLLLAIYGDTASLCLLGIHILATLICYNVYPGLKSGRKALKLICVISVVGIAVLTILFMFSIVSRGEWWYLIERYDSRGLLTLAIALFSCIMAVRADHMELNTGDIPWILIGVVFLIQSFIYPLSVISMPIYLIYAAGVGIPSMAGDDVEAETERSGLAETASVMGASEADQASLDDDLEFMDLDDADTDRIEIMTDNEWPHKVKPRKPVDRSREITMHIGLLISACACLIVGGALATMIVLGPSPAASTDHDADADALFSEAGDEAGLLDSQAENEYESSVYDVADMGDMSEYDLDDLGVDLTGIDLAALGLDVDEEGNASAYDVTGEADASDVDGTTESADQSGHISISNGDYTVYDPEAEYMDCSDIVGPASGSTRLRSEPSLGDEGQIVHVLASNERVVRDGIGDNGWSRVQYRGRTCYAVTDYLSVMGTYHGDPAELIVETESETSTEDVDQSNGTDANNQTTDSQGNAGPAQSQTQTAVAGAKGKTGPAGYSIQWSADNKTCTIWSAGVKQGTLTVTDGQDAQKINVYSDYYVGSGKNTHKYLSISVPAGENPLYLSADGGFMSALRNMGYSGVYFNKQVTDW